MPATGPKCYHCTKEIPLLQPDQEDMGNTDLGLTIEFHGSYGEFVDNGGGFFDGPKPFIHLCHECAHDAADLLGVDASDWHTCARQPEQENEPPTT